MTAFEEIDFFTDEALLEDPYPYFDYLRAQCPVVATPHHGVVAVSGWEEATEIYRDLATFSSCNSVVGPFAQFPVPLEGDDVSDVIDRYRDQLPMSEHMVTMDPPDHTRERALLMRLLSPMRLKQNESFMWRLADRQLDEFVGRGSCEFISAYAQPFAMLVVADLLGVPEADHQRFREGFGLLGAAGELRTTKEGDVELNALGWLDDWFASYIEDRRRTPRDDVLTELAVAKYPDGSTPEVTSVVRTATFLFAAGQETTARLLATSLKYLAESPQLQDELRGERRAHSRLRRGGSPHREPGQGRLPPRASAHQGRRRRHRRGHAGHAAERRRQPRPAALRVPGGVPPRPPECTGAHRVRTRRALVPGRAVGTRGGSRQPGAHPRPDARDPPLRRAPRASDRASVRLRADLGPPRAEHPAPRVHAGILSPSAARVRRGRRGARGPGRRCAW